MGVCGASLTSARRRRWLLLLAVLLVSTTVLVLRRKRRHFLSVLAIFKNEEMSLETWLKHQVSQGVDHVYLIDNNSTDRSAKLLQPWIDSGVVTYAFVPEPHKQMVHIRSFIKSRGLQRTTDWLAICDIDEYYFGTRFKLSTTLRKFENFDVVYSHWLIFGYNNQVNQPVDVRLSNTMRHPGLDECKKYIFRPAIVDINKIHIHHVEYPTKRARRVTCEDELIHLNHYRLQSIVYYNTTKMGRGDVFNASLDGLRTWDYFWGWNANSKQEDLTLKKIVLDPPADYWS